MPQNIPITLRLRALEPEDLSFVYELENTADVAEHTADYAPVSRYAVRRYLEQMPSEPYTVGELRLMVVMEKDGGEVPVGMIDLTGLNLRDGHAEVGLAVHPDYRGQGVGQGALSLIEPYARRMRLHTLTAQVTESNKPAQSLFTQAGYTHVGTFPEYHRSSEKSKTNSEKFPEGREKFLDEACAEGGYLDVWEDVLLFWKRIGG